MNEKSRKILTWALSVGFHSIFAIITIQSQHLIALQMGTKAEAITIETFEAPRGEQTEIKAETKTEADLQVKKEEPKTLPEKKVETISEPIAVKKSVQPKKSSPKKTKVAKKVAPQKKEKKILATTLPDKEKVADYSEFPQPEEFDSPEALAPTIQESDLGPDMDSDLAHAESEPVEDLKKYDEVESREPEIPVTSNQKPSHQVSTPISGGTDKKTEIPAFGTPGTLISESRLSEAGGNRPPSYPRDARKKGVQGKVEIRAYVSKDGKIEQPAIHRSSGSGMLDYAALDAFSKWRYRPGLTGWLIKPFSFRLTEN